MEVALGIYALFAVGLGIFALRDRDSVEKVLLRKKSVGATYWGAYDGHQANEDLCAQRVALPQPLNAEERAKWNKSLKG